MIAGGVITAGLRRWATPLAALLAATVEPAEAFGQVIRGTIVESVTGDAVTQASIVVLGGEGDTAAAILADDAGAFLVSGIEWGTYVLSVNRLGYHPHVDGPLRVTPSDTVDVRYQLDPLAVRLDPVVVQTAATVLYLQRAGFYHRERLGFGHQVEPERIELRRATARDIADLMVGIPGVRIQYPRAGAFGKTVKLTGMPSLTVSCSAPLFFVDGIRVLASGTLEEAVRPEDVLAIEIFRRPSEIPAQYGGPDSGCGVILIWTGRANERRKR